MKTRDIFLNISPLDHRYSLSEEKLFDTLSSFISEEASVVSCAKAEAALVKAHLSLRGLLDESTEHTLDEAAHNID
ncbi:MAG: adenylosuccinate lyase, partial [Treponema maltophilum]